MIVNIQHEYGHIHKPLLVYINSQKDIFNSPYVELKLPKNKNIKTEEGGEVIEYLLYDRIIHNMNMKEVIYINNLKNFSKNVKDFREGFLNLKNETLLTVLQRESKDNPEIM